MYTSMVRPLTSNTTMMNTSGIRSDVTSDFMTYAYLTLVTSLLSLFGGIGIIAMYFLYKDLRTHGRTLLAFLSLADAVLACGNILGVIWVLGKDGPVIHGSMVYCQFHSALTIYASIAAFCWTAVMALCLFMSIVMVNMTFTVTYMKVFHLVSWGLPAVVTTAALSADVLGYDHNLTQANWCWIDTTVPNAVLWQLFTGKVWEISCSVVTAGLYISALIYIRRKAKASLVSKSNRKSRKAAMEEANRKLTFVPLVFILCRMWGTTRFFLGNISHEAANKPEATWIVPLQGIGDSAQGFANFVVYCWMTDSVRSRILKTLACCPRKDSLASSPPPAQTPHIHQPSAVDALAPYKPTNVNKCRMTSEVNDVSTMQ